MAYKILIRKNYEKVLLHFCSLFDSEQENTLLVRWSFDSFKKVCFEAFLRSDPVYWTVKAVIRQNRSNAEYEGYDVPNWMKRNNVITFGLLRCYLSFARILKHARQK